MFLDVWYNFIILSLYFSFSAKDLPFYFGFWAMMQSFFFMMTKEEIFVGDKFIRYRLWYMDFIWLVGVYMVGYDMNFLLVCYIL